MKLSNLLAGATALALAVGAGSSAFAAPGVATTQFQLSGSVTSTCLISFPTTTIAVGNIPVNSVATASYTTYFHMTAADTYAQDLGGQGGCNDLNTVVVSKANGATGLEDANTTSFDPTVFTNALPYYFSIGWTGPQGWQTGPQASSLNSTDATPTEGTQGATVTNGAFASPMNVFVTIPAPTLGLLAGTYTDTVTVTLTAI